MDMNRNDNCHTMGGVDEMALTMAYVPWQHFSETYEPAKALKGMRIYSWSVKNPAKPSPRSS